MLTISTAADAFAQAPLPIYTDHFVNGFQDWSWASHTLNNTAPVHSGTNSISVNGSAGQALSFYHAGFNTTPYASVSFWAHGGATGGQVLQVYVSVNGLDQPAAAPLARLSANTWQRFDVSLASLNADSQTNVSRFYIRLTGSGTTTTFYVDDVQLTAKPAPAIIHLSVNAAQAVRQVDFRWFGVNTAIWDSNFDTHATVSLLQEMGARFLRFPGGSLSDEYHWATGKSLTNTWRWVTSFSNFVHVATNVGVQAIITVNYGTGIANEAAAWVRHANVTNRLGFKYWEIGNECYGSWETDSNAYPHDPYTYAVRARDYIQAMRTADPTIKIGVVAASGENSYSNRYSLNHPVMNLRTGQINYGWTPIMLTTLKSLGVTPDFLIEHNYPQYTGGESDPLLLQSTSSWASEAADLRQQLSDYLGTNGTGVELLCTENNSNSGSQGKQSTSLVNGLYYADSLGRLMQTELNGFVWWDLRNGTDISGSFDPTLYGWRTVGDLGMVNGPDTRFPTFYAAKMMRYFAQPGDTILSSVSDYLLLSAYGARTTNGLVSMLVLNKDTTTSFNAQVALPGFTPEAAVTMRSYGMPQDIAAQRGVGGQDIAQTNFTIATANFSGSFPPLSLTLLTFSPMRLAVQPAWQTAVAGSTTAYTASITPVSWLTNSVALSVVGLPAGVSAAFSPPSVRGAGSSRLSLTPGYISPGTYPLTIIASGDGLTNTASVALTISLGLVAWGNNDFGQGAMPGALSNAVAIAAGGYHSLALRSDGSVVAWGDDSSGQTDVPASATNVVAIGAGGWHSLALREDGGVIAWGDNGLNQTAVPAGLADVVAIAAGGQHSLALRSDGTVAAWGSWFDPNGDYGGQIEVPTDLSQVVAVAAGGYHSLALRADGTVVAWGYNAQGQATVPAGLSGVVRIAGGEAHSLALRADGAVMAWGDNTYGQCAVGPAWGGVIAIAAGGSHSLALLGQRPSEPQLGNPLRNGTTFTLSVPTVRGWAYFLQYKDSVTDTNWISPSAMVGNGSVKTLTDSTARAPYRFYRVRQQ